MGKYKTEYEMHIESALYSLLTLIILLTFTIWQYFTIKDYENTFFKITNYLISLFSISALIIHFFKLEKNRAITIIGTVLIVLLYIAVSIISFANIYYAYGLFENNQIIHDKTHSIYFSLSNFINRSTNFNCHKNIEFLAAIQTLYGLITLGFFISKSIEVLPKKEEK